jgi:hypothetical protein
VCLSATQRGSVRPRPLAKFRGRTPTASLKRFYAKNEVESSGLAGYSSVPLGNANGPWCLSVSLGVIPQQYLPEILVGNGPWRLSVSLGIIPQQYLPRGGADVSLQWLRNHCRRTVDGISVPPGSSPSTSACLRLDIIANIKSHALKC